jgi:hypothetical protein
LFLQPSCFAAIYAVAILALSRFKLPGLTITKGYDIDQPRHIHKVTRTA